MADCVAQCTGFQESRECERRSLTTRRTCIFRCSSLAYLMKTRITRIGGSAASGLCAGWQVVVSVGVQLSLGRAITVACSSTPYITDPITPLHLASLREPAKQSMRHILKTQSSDSTSTGTNVRSPTARNMHRHLSRAEGCSESCTLLWPWKPFTEDTYTTTRSTSK